MVADVGADVEERTGAAGRELGHQLCFVPFPRSVVADPRQHHVVGRQQQHVRVADDDVAGLRDGGVDEPRRFEDRFEVTAEPLDGVLVVVEPLVAGLDEVVDRFLTALDVARQLGHPVGDLPDVGLVAPELLGAHPARAAELFDGLAQRLGTGVLPACDLFGLGGCARVLLDGPFQRLDPLE